MDRSILIEEKYRAIQMWLDENYAESAELALKLERTKLLNADYEFNQSMGSCFMDMNKNSIALRFVNRCIKVDPNNELASSMRYICLIDLKKYVQGIDELKRYLDNNKTIKAYDITIKELLGEFQKGKSLAWHDLIIGYCYKFNIPIEEYFPNFEKISSHVVMTKSYKLKHVSSSAFL